MHTPPHQLRFFHGGYQFAVFQYCAGGIARQTTQSENDHLPPLSRFSIFAHVSRSVVVRLNTGFPGAESGSTQK